MSKIIGETNLTWQYLSTSDFMRLRAHVEQFGVFEGSEELREWIRGGRVGRTEGLLRVREAAEQARHHERLAHCGHKLLWHVLQVRDDERALQWY